MTVRLAPSADVDDRATIGDGSSVWHLAQVCEDAILGRNCICTSACSPPVSALATR
jgi:UDP-3-O-[3-hydroxymyristoyl] glucosamine N-acyltransferase